jgi:predicted DNA-binding protein
MKKKSTMFSFNLRDDLKERLDTRGKKFGTTFSYQINRAIELQLMRDEETEKGIKANEELYGPINPPEDIDDLIRDAKKRF